VRSTAEPRRILWVLNHRRLMPDELGILRSLGFAVFTPRVLPSGTDWRSTAVEENPDREALRLPPETLALLERYRFYERPWTPTLASILNEHFEAVVTALYPAPFISAVRHFRGRVIARAFGREGDANYASWIAAWQQPGLEDAIAALGSRYVFGQAYPVLAEVERPPHARRAVTLPLPAPGWVAPAAGSWTGEGRDLLFLCPLIGASDYYEAVYRRIKQVAGDIPHRIFGHQTAPVHDPAVLPPTDDAALLSLYASTAAFVYPAVEPRHLHYSPLEAMMVGAPVLYLRGALLDRMAGEALPGACAGLDEMRAKAAALARGDTALSAAIRAGQPSLLARFAPDAARAAWRRLLCTEGEA
jgi:hypothetical protein